MTAPDKQTRLKGLIENGRYYEYTKAADPIGSGAIPQIPFADFGSELHETGCTRIIPLDISAKLGCEGPATSPALCANFVGSARCFANLGLGKSNALSWQPRFSTAAAATLISE